jgi:uncharacterized protein YunC (DUF1805 family)
VATIIVEDGSLVTGANSYISEADLTTYATDRGITITGTNAVLIIQAMDYIEQQSFKGFKFTEPQALVWPRAGVEVDSFLVDSDEIPTLLIEGLAETALAIDAGNSPLATVTRSTKLEKVGELEVEYMDNAVTTNIARTINNKLGKLLDGNVSGMTYNVIRV